MNQKNASKNISVLAIIVDLSDVCFLFYFVASEGTTDASGHIHRGMRTHVCRREDYENT